MADSCKNNLDEWNFSQHHIRICINIYIHILCLSGCLLIKWLGYINKSTKQGSWGLTSTEATIAAPVWVCGRSWAYMLWLCTWCFCVFLKMGAGMLADSLPSSWNPLLLLVCLMHHRWEGFVLSLTVSYYTVIDWYPYEACSFQKCIEWGEDLGRWGMGEGTGRNGGRGNCGHFILYERRIRKKEIVD